MKFEKVIKDITGGNTKFKTTEYLTEGILPIIDQSSNFISGYTNEDCKVKTTRKDIIVFGDHTKEFKFIDFDFCIGADGVKVLEPVEELDSKFLYYFFQTVYLPDVGYSRHYKFLKENEIPLPSLSEQKSIAAQLDKADELIRYNRQLIEKYDELQQSLFLDMFGDPVINEKGWERKNLGEINKQTSNINKEFAQSQIQYIDISSINNVENTVEFTTLYKTEERPSRAQQILLKNDILFSTVRPNLKNIAINNIDGAIGTTGFFVIRVNDLVNNRYIFNLLKSDNVTDDFMRLVSGANYPALKNSELKKYKIPIPPLSLQNEFASHISSIEYQKELVKEALAKSEDVFNGLLQEFFGG